MPTFTFLGFLHVWGISVNREYRFPRLFVSDPSGPSKELYFSWREKNLFGLSSSPTRCS